LDMARAQGAGVRQAPAPEAAKRAARPLVRIIAIPAGTAARRTWWATLEDGSVLCERSRQPLLDGARALIMLGHDRDALVTLRHAGKPYDSFVPVRLSAAANLTTAERDVKSIRFARWRPFLKPAGSGTRGAEISAISDAPATHLPVEVAARPAATPRARGASDDI